MSCGHESVICAGEDWTVELTWTLYSHVLSTAKAAARLRVRARIKLTAALNLMTAIMEKAADSHHPLRSDNAVSVPDWCV